MSVDKTFNTSEEYKLGADRYQYILYKRRVVADEESKNFGVDQWDQESYFPKIQDVIKYLAEMGIKEHIDELYVARDWVKKLESKIDVLKQAYKDRKGLR